MPGQRTLSRGELVLIVGGNGADKSTLLKRLTGLYRTQQRVLLLDGNPLDAADDPAYRSFVAILWQTVLAS